MKPHLRFVALAAALALAAPALPAFAQGAPTKAQQQEAATRFKKGYELFKDGDYKAALIEFRRANELAPNYNVLYNIGQVYFQLQDYPNALASLTRYLAEGGRNIPSARRAEVEKDIEKLKARVANVEITSAVADADVLLDDEPIGKTPLGKPILVSAGRHKITVSKAGFTAATKVVEVASADSVKVTLDPIEQKAAEGPKVEPPPPPEVVQPGTPVEPPPAAAKSTYVPWAGIVITSGLTVGAVVTGILALGASSDLKAERESPDATRDSLSKARDKTTAFALVTDILAGGAIVSLGITIYVGVSGNSDKPKAKSGLPGPGVVKITNVGVGPGSLQVGGVF